MHRVQKPRERLAMKGASALKEEELLAILLRTGYAGKDVFSVSRGLVKKYPGKTLFELPFSKLKNIKGVGVSRASTLQAAWELTKRLSGESNGSPAIKTPQDVIAQVQEIRSRKKENFVVLYLNARNQLIHKEFVSIGTLNSSLVHPREVYEPAIRHSAASLILVHNHPSGDVQPSEDDHIVTHRLVEAGCLLGIEVLDHVVVSEQGFYSFKDEDQL